MRARAVIRTCPVPVPWDVDELVRAVAEQRGRPIELITRPAARDSVTGTVYAEFDADVIVIRDDLVGLHRDHVVCHEIAHVLAGHLDDLTVADVFVSPDLAGAAAIMLNRDCSHGDEREQEAELIAEMLIRKGAHASLAGFASGLG